METPLSSTESKIKTLKTCDFLRGLKDSVLGNLAAQAEVLDVAREEKIITQGEDGSNMYFIISGSVRVHLGDVILARIGIGDVFGEMAVLDSEKRSASITTEAESVLLRVGRDVFYESLSSDPDAFRAVIHGVLQRGRETIREVKTRSKKLMAYEKEMEIGRRIQAGFLPSSIPVLKNWQHASSFVAAREVAGDFYDIFKLNNLPHLAIVIGDVCDKGVGAALFMTLYGELPNDFLLEMTTSLKEGKVLCLAEGEGRNAVHLARHGFSATGVDSSGVGLNKAQKLAQKHGVKIETIHADLAEFSLGENTWDSIISISCHLPPELRRKIHRGVVSGLKQGGTFLLEAYTPKQLEFGTGGPPSAEFMMELETLRKELEGLEFIHGKELTRDLVEGINHTGKGSVVQVLARKC